MTHAHDLNGTVFKNASAVLLARVVDAHGDEVQQSDLTAIEYSIYELDPCRPDFQSSVAGHQNVSLDVADVIFDTLQTGGMWTADDVGYNFRHEIDVTANEAFPKAGAQYQVRYELTPTSGQKTIVRFQLRVI